MIGARDVTAHLGGKWYGTYGAAPCPICQPERRQGQDALTLADGRAGLLAHCKKSHCGFPDILKAAGLQSGNWAAPDPAEAARRDTERRAEAEKRARQAQAVWDDALPIAGTVAETYLRGRGISCPLPPSLRFAPSCWHVSARRYPALVGLVEGGEGFAVHRTYLRPDGTGKAEADPPKAMLGAVAGGAVRLAHAPGRLVVAEGIETTLSLACGLLDAPATVWAALSASGLRALRLPPRPGRLTVAVDGDREGRAAGVTLAERAHAAGWRVDILDPGDGRDWNDWLRMEMAA